MLDARKRVPPLGAAPRQYLAAVLGFHSRAEAMFLMAAANMLLKRMLRQRIFSLTGAMLGFLKDSALSRSHFTQAEQLVYASHYN